MLCLSSVLLALAAFHSSVTSWDHNEDANDYLPYVWVFLMFLGMRHAGDWSRASFDRAMDIVDYYQDVAWLHEGMMHFSWPILLTATIAASRPYRTTRTNATPIVGDVDDKSNTVEATKLARTNEEKTIEGVESHAAVDEPKEHRVQEANAASCATEKKHEVGMLDLKECIVQEMHATQSVAKEKTASELRNCYEDEKTEKGSKVSMSQGNKRALSSEPGLPLARTRQRELALATYNSASRPHEVVGSRADHPIITQVQRRKSITRASHYPSKTTVGIEKNTRSTKGCYRNNTKLQKYVSWSKQYNDTHYLVDKVTGRVEKRCPSTPCLICESNPRKKKEDPQATAPMCVEIVTELQLALKLDNNIAAKVSYAEDDFQGGEEVVLQKDDTVVEEVLETPAPVVLIKESEHVVKLVGNTDMKEVDEPLTQAQSAVQIVAQAADDTLATGELTSKPPSTPMKNVVHATNNQAAIASGSIVGDQQSSKARTNGECERPATLLGVSAVQAPVYFDMSMRAFVKQTAKLDQELEAAGKTLDQGILASEAGLTTHNQLQNDDEVITEPNVAADEEMLVDPAIVAGEATAASEEMPAMHLNIQTAYGMDAEERMNGEYTGCALLPLAVAEPQNHAEPACDMPLATIDQPLLSVSIPISEEVTMYGDHQQMPSDTTLAGSQLMEEAHVTLRTAFNLGFIADMQPPSTPQTTSDAQPSMHGQRPSAQYRPGSHKGLRVKHTRVPQVESPTVCFVSRGCLPETQRLVGYKRRAPDDDYSSEQNGRRQAFLNPSAWRTGLPQGYLNDVNEEARSKEGYVGVFRTWAIEIVQTIKTLHTLTPVKHLASVCQLVSYLESTMSQLVMYHKACPQSAAVNSDLYYGLIGADLTNWYLSTVLDYIRGIQLVDPDQHIFAQNAERSLREFKTYIAEQGGSTWCKQLALSELHANSRLPDASPDECKSIASSFLAELSSPQYTYEVEMRLRQLHEGLIDAIESGNPGYILLGLISNKQKRASLVSLLTTLSIPYVWSRIGLCWPEHDMRPVLVKLSYHTHCTIQMNFRYSLSTSDTTLLPSKACPMIRNLINVTGQIYRYHRAEISPQDMKWDIDNEGARQSLVRTFRRLSDDGLKFEPYPLLSTMEQPYASNGHHIDFLDQCVIRALKHPQELVYSIDSEMEEMNGSRETYQRYCWNIDKLNFLNRALGTVGRGWNLVLLRQSGDDSYRATYARFLDAIDRFNPYEQNGLKHEEMHGLQYTPKQLADLKGHLGFFRAQRGLSLTNALIRWYNQMQFRPSQLG